MTAADGDRQLERGYRRLLACYPHAHRSRHEREMLGVLMSGARDGQRRPGLAESADLIRGALRIRLRPVLGTAADPSWRDALALFSVVLPLLMLTLTAMSVLLYRRQGVIFPPHAAVTGLLLQGQLLVVPLVLARLRRTAALAAVATLIWMLGVTIVGPASYNATELTAYFCFLGLEALALLLSPGPSRGLELLGWRRTPVLLIAGVAGAAVVTSGSPVAAHRGGLIAVMALAVLVIIVIALALASVTSRRVVALLAIPAYPFVLAMLVPQRPGSVSLPELTLACLPLLAAGCLAGTAIRRSGRA